MNTKIGKYVAILDRQPITAGRKHESHIQSLHLKAYGWCIEASELGVMGLPFSWALRGKERSLDRDAKKHLYSSHLLIYHSKQALKNLQNTPKQHQIYSLYLFSTSWKSEALKKSLNKLEMLGHPKSLNIKKKKNQKTKMNKLRKE